MIKLLPIYSLIVIGYTIVQLYLTHGKKVWLIGGLLGIFEIASVIYFPETSSYRLFGYVLVCFSILQWKQQISYVVLGFSLILYVSSILLYQQTTHALIPMQITVLFLLICRNERFLRKSYEESMNEYQNRVLQKQVDEVQNIYLIMRGWRHDYHNHLQNLKAKLQMNQMKQAKQYLDELENDLDDIHQLVESGNVNVDAILNSKLSLAMKQNIKLDYKANVPSHIQIQDIDLCVLIGNLVDNAIEACEQVTSEQPFLRLYIGIFRKQLYISVTNSTKELVRKLDDEYITKKRGNHGHGLKRINNVVEKYDGYINRKNEPGVFVTEIMLPLK